MTEPSTEERAAPIRILIANLSGVLAQVVVQLVEQQPDMVLVGQVKGQVELLVSMQSQVDVLMLGAPQTYPPPGICSHLLSEYSDLKILVLASTGDAAMVYWLGLRRHRLRQVSTTTLLSNIRQAYRLNPTV